MFTVMCQNKIYDNNNITRKGGIWNTLFQVPYTTCEIIYYLKVILD